MTLMESAEELGNLGEFVGAVAVVVTLVYLTIQVRQNTQAIRFQSGRESASPVADLATVLIQREIVARRSHPSHTDRSVSSAPVRYRPASGSASAVAIVSSSRRYAAKRVSVRAVCAICASTWSYCSASIASLTRGSVFTP